MSYEIVRSATVSPDGTVTMKTASNNVTPRYPSTWVMSYRSNDNPFTGKLAADVEVLAGYEQGNFQGGSNRFVRQLEVLRHLPEYASYDWRGNWEGTKDTRDNNRKGYYELLAKALATPAPKPRFALTKDNWGQTMYFKQRKGAYSGYWMTSPKHANLYRYADDAERVKSCFNNSDNWKVIEVVA